MDLERFEKRKEKNKGRSRIVLGGSFCKKCGEYSMGGSHAEGIDSDGNYTSTSNVSKPEIKDGVCEYCIEDLELECGLKRFRGRLKVNRSYVSYAGGGTWCRKCGQYCGDDLSVVFQTGEEPTKSGYSPDVTNGVCQLCIDDLTTPKRLPRKAKKEMKKYFKRYKSL